jgi:hypothetical protein
VTHIEDPKRKASRLTVERLADGFGERTRVMPALEVMQRRGALTHRQAEAGRRLYEDWAVGICCARDSEAGGSTVHDPGGFTDRQLDAARRYRQARDAVGARMWPCLFAISCNEWSIERFANERGAGMDVKQWRGVFKVSLDILADFYGMD